MSNCANLGVSASARNAKGARVCTRGVLSVRPRALRGMGSLGAAFEMVRPTRFSRLLVAMKFVDRRQLRRARLHRTAFVE